MDVFVKILFFIICTVGHLDLRWALKTKES